MTTFAPARPRRRPHRGFSLVELLVVLGIIVIIASMVVVGLSTLAGRNERTRTEARLSVLETMVENYRNATGSKVGQGLDTGARNLPYYDAGFISVPAGSGAIATGVTDNTASVITTLLAVPTNRELRDAQDNDFVADAAIKDDAERTVPIGVPVDGSGNAILYVPSEGITVGAGGIAKPDGSWWQGRPATNDLRLVARDRNPYFVSPGEDGDYSTHGDNVYSRPVVGYDFSDDLLSE